MAIYERLEVTTAEELESYLKGHTNNGKVVILHLHDGKKSTSADTEFKETILQEIPSNQVIIASIFGGLLGEYRLGHYADTTRFPENWRLFGELHTHHNAMRISQETQTIIDGSKSSYVYVYISSPTRQIEVEKQFLGWTYREDINYSEKYITYDGSEAIKNAFRVLPHRLFICRKSKTGEIERFGLDRKAMLSLVWEMPREFFLNPDAARVIYRAIGEEIALADWSSIRPNILLEYWQPLLREKTHRYNQLDTLRWCKEEKLKLQGKRVKLELLSQLLKKKFAVLNAKRRLQKLLLADLE